VPAQDVSEGQAEAVQEVALAGLAILKERLSCRIQAICDSWVTNVGGVASDLMASSTCNANAEETE